MSDFHGNQVVPFEIDHVSLELIGDHELVRDLARKPRAPEVPIQERSHAEEMVALAVGDIDRCQVLAAPTTESTRASACSTVIGASTRTASCLSDLCR